MEGLKKLAAVGIGTWRQANLWKAAMTRRMTGALMNSPRTPQIQSERSYFEARMGLDEFTTENWRWA